MALSPNVVVPPTIILPGLLPTRSDKIVLIPASHKLIKAGQERSGNIMVPKGFAYNEVSVGDLKKVEITLELIDVDGKLIKSVVRVFDLSG